MTEKLKNGILENRDILELREVIVKFKENGGTIDTAKSILESLRSEFQNQSEKEDKILELMDFVWGWCQERYKIW